MKKQSASKYLTSKEAKKLKKELQVPTTFTFMGMVLPTYPNKK
jgi:hypothetical protein